MFHYLQLRELERQIHAFWLQVAAISKTINQRKHMPNDPLVELAAIKTAYESLVAQVNTLTSALAAAQAANPTSDFVTPDVQGALDALATEVAAPPAPAAPAPAPPPPPAPGS